MSPLEHYILQKLGLNDEEYFYVSQLYRVPQFLYDCTGSAKQHHGICGRNTLMSLEFVALFSSPGEISDSDTNSFSNSPFQCMAGLYNEETKVIVAL